MAVRPTKYTEDTIRRLEQAIELGAPYTQACQYAGITEETLSQWRKHKAGFSERIKAAEGRAVVGWLAMIQKAAPDHWQAAAWKLERKYPNDFGQRARVDVNVTLRQEAERLADELGLDVDAVLAEAGAILAGTK